MNKIKEQREGEVEMNKVKGLEFSEISSGEVIE